MRLCIIMDSSRGTSKRTNVILGSSLVSLPLSCSLDDDGYTDGN